MNVVSEGSKEPKGKNEDTEGQVRLPRRHHGIIFRPRELLVRNTEEEGSGDAIHKYHKPTSEQRHKHKKMPILSFIDDEKVNGRSNEIFLLVVMVGIQNHDVARCLVDEGSSVEIMYENSLEKLGLKKEDLKAYDDI